MVSAIRFLQRPPTQADPLIRQGRHSRHVHVGHSWDIESDDAPGVTVRYIEVKGRGPADANVVELTDPEWVAARRLGGPALALHRAAGGGCRACGDGVDPDRIGCVLRWIGGLRGLAREEGR